MTTLKETVNIIREFFERHLQIQTVNVTLDDSDYNAISDIVYPVVNIQYLDTDINEYADRNFKIIIASRSNKKIKDIDMEILSDCEDIAMDFFSFLDENIHLEWGGGASLQPFEEGTTDRTTGVTFTISISHIRDTCIDDIPVS